MSYLVEGCSPTGDYLSISHCVAERETGGGAGGTDQQVRALCGQFGNNFTRHMRVGWQRPCVDTHLYIEYVE